MKIPILAADVVYHVGTLDRSHRGIQGESQEGALLSVSMCPSAWREIAKLPCSQTLALSLESSRLQFIDMLAIFDDKALQEEIADWGIDHGWAVRETLWRAWDYDPEQGEWCFSEHLTEALALNELDEDDEHGESRPDGAPRVDAFEALVGTQKLALAANIQGVTRRDAFDYVVIEWAMANCIEVHGVWWDEYLDVAGLSAPRGGLFPSCLATLTVTDVSQVSIDEDELLDQVEIDTDSAPASPRP